MPSKAARSAGLALALAAGSLFAVARLPWLALSPPSPGAVRHTAAADAHRVASLPGFGSLRSTCRLFSGEVPISKDKALFYALVEAERRPRDAPVVLWLTG